MKTMLSSNQGTVTLIALGLALGSVLVLSSEASADGFAECNQILAQDIFNKISTSDSSSSISAAETAEMFFIQSDTQAWDMYSKAADRAEKKGTKIDAEFHYGVIGGEFGLDITSEKRVSENEFKQAFRSAQNKREGSKTSKSSSGQTAVNTYASRIRDSGTINAWKECVTKTKETNLYAFASRDTGQVYVNVMWVPGALAGTLPSIPISFVTNSAGIKIDSKPEEYLAMGSGRSFLVKCQKPCDDGFMVVVNGTIKDPAGRPTSSFTTNVEVPPKTPLVEKLCQTIAGHAIYFNGNGYHGVIGPRGIGLQSSEEGYVRFQTNVVFSKATDEKFGGQKIDDPIVGKCQGTSISFTRKLRDGSAHRHSGTLSKSSRGDISMTGSFSDEDGKTYSWSGQLGDPVL
jgi:hypothetical protein